MMADGAYTGFFAVSGHPVVVVPVGQTAVGLPIEMQILGKRWREMELLSLVQKIRPGH